jgi:hypothetical protein
MFCASNEALLYPVFIERFFFFRNFIYINDVMEEKNRAHQAVTTTMRTMRKKVYFYFYKVEVEEV